MSVPGNKMFVKLFVIFQISYFCFGLGNFDLKGGNHNLRHHRHERRVQESQDTKFLKISPKREEVHEVNSFAGRDHLHELNIKSFDQSKQKGNKLMGNESSMKMNTSRTIVKHLWIKASDTGKQPHLDESEYYDDISTNLKRNNFLNKFNDKSKINSYDDYDTNEEFLNDDVVNKWDERKFRKDERNFLKIGDYYEMEENDYDTLDDKFDNSQVDLQYDRILLKRKTYFEPEEGFSATYIPGTLTKHKYETLGTPEAVKKSRKSLFTSRHQSRDMAKMHARKVDLEARCKYPKPKIERIQKETSKIYVPHCTILYRCADDTGCCNSDRQTCVAKRFEDVPLYFFVKSLGSAHGTVEKHTFINHTECECIERSRNHNHQYSSTSVLKPSLKSDCLCPRLFETVLQRDGCRCDCSSGNSGCDSLKRGMEHFSLTDRKCINEGRCKVPTCEYGSYIRKVGQCPRKEDKIIFSRSFH